MRKSLYALAAAGAMLPLVLGAAPAFAQKAGGILKIYHRGNPPSASIIEEATTSTNMPYMAVYNNLVIFDQHEPINSMETIRPELATEWSWNEDKTELTFKLREGVKWHDGEDFTAEDVVCTWDLLLGTSEKWRLRKNPRKIWWVNVEKVTADDDYTATFHLKRRQPGILMLLASGYSPIYPCHVSPKQMRTNPIGTGPFKFESFNLNQSIKLVKNEDYWKEGLPYLDGIEYGIIRSRSTRILAFIAGEYDMTFSTDVTVASLKDVESQAPDAVCELVTTGVTTNLIINREKPPFDNAEIRHAFMLALDRDAFIEILTEGKAKKGAVMMPPPNGVWGMPDEMLADLPGYGDVEANREEARKIMEGLGYGPDNMLPLTISTRNIAIYRDPAVILADQLKEIYVQAEIEVVETSNWHAKVGRKDYSVGLNLTGAGVDSPDAKFFENYGCGSQRNYTGYCNEELQKLFVKQSMMTDMEKRKELVWEIDAKLQEDEARPIISHRVGATCYQPYVKNFTMMRNSSYNGWRFEDVWLDK